MTYNFLAHDREGSIELAIDDLYDLVDGMLGAGRFEEVDDLLRELCAEPMTVELAVAILTITNAASALLPARPAFYAKTAILVGEDADAVLWGLIYKPSDFKDPTGPEWFDELCIYCRKSTGYVVTIANASNRVPMHADCAEAARGDAPRSSAEEDEAPGLKKAIKIVEGRLRVARTFSTEMAKTKPEVFVTLENVLIFLRAELERLEPDGGEPPVNQSPDGLGD